MKSLIMGTMLLFACVILQAEKHTLTIENKSNQPILLVQKWLSKHAEIQGGPYNCTRGVTAAEPIFRNETTEQIEPGDMVIVTLKKHGSLRLLNNNLVFSCLRQDTIVPDSRLTITNETIFPSLRLLCQLTIGNDLEEVRNHILLP